MAPRSTRIGALTKIYTALLLADAVQRKELDFDTAVADLVPPGVSIPTRDRLSITLKHLALHSSGLPRVPPSMVTRGNDPDPYAKYDDDALYRDLAHTELEAPPGTQIVYSNYGSGLLGFVLGKKLGGSYDKAVRERIIAPLGLRDTFVKLPHRSRSGAHRAPPTTSLRPAPGAGARSPAPAA